MTSWKVKLHAYGLSVIGWDALFIFPDFFYNVILYDSWIPPYVKKFL